MAVLNVHVPLFNKKVNRKVVDYRPKLLLIFYGKTDLKQLLRLKNCY